MRIVSTVNPSRTASASPPGGASSKIMDVKDAYNQVASSYDGSYEDPVSLAEDEYVFGELSKIITSKDRVIDLGCGTGFFLDKMKCNPRKYVGLDCSPKMLEIARQKHRGYFFVENYMEHMRDIPNGIADVVISLYGSIGYAEPSRTAKEIDRITKPGSRIYLMFYANPEEYKKRETYILKRKGLQAQMYDVVGDVKGLYWKFKVEEDTTLTYWLIVKGMKIRPET